MEVAFIQYLRPDGRRRKELVVRPDDICTKALALQHAGYELAIEVLMTGQVSMTVEHTDEDRLDEEGSIGHEICSNGPDVLAAVDRLIETAYAKAAIAKATQP